MTKGDKLTFTGGVNAASQEYEPRQQNDRCPLCGIALNENGVRLKCGYKSNNFPVCSQASRSKERLAIFAQK